MKKTLILTSSILTSSFFLLPSSFAAGGIYLPVHSYEKSTSSLHVRESSTANLADGSWPEEKEWTFPASYTGHRSVCWLPGATSNMAFYAWVGGDKYSPGDPFGFTLAASSNNVQAIALTRTSVITPRIDIWTGQSDRSVVAGETTSLADVFAYATNSSYPLVSTNMPLSDFAVQPASIPDTVRIRVVRFAVDRFYTFSIGCESRVMLDRIFTKSARSFICEADFLSDGKFDIDWDSFASDSSGLSAYDLDRTNVTYLVVVGDGPTTLNRPYDSNTQVTALGTYITRRFDYPYAGPEAIGLADGNVLCGARPTFVWSVPGESDYAKRFGSSYTAFRISMAKGTSPYHDIYLSSVIPNLVPGTKGNFVWTSPFTVGDQLLCENGNPLVFENGTNYKWCVAMYNAKFKPSADSGNDGWSPLVEFSTATNTAAASSTP